MVRSLQARLVGLFVVLSLVLGLLPSLAQAQTACPASAYSGGTIAAGNRVQIVGVSDADAYYTSSSGLIGKTGRVDQMDPTGGAACWHGGQFYGDDGSSFYFYQVAVQVLGAATTTSSACPGGATTYAMTEGQRIKILGVHPDDAYYADAGTLIGMSGVVSGDLHSNDGCWMGGGFTADNGAYYYFYKVAVLSLGGSAPTATTGPACPGGSATVGMTEGTRVKILGVHPDDAYYADAGTLIGLSGVVSGDLHSNDGCWMGGGFTADNGAYYYFYKAAVQNLGGAAVVGSGTCPAGAYTGAVPATGTRVKVLTVSPSDAYYPSISDYGLVGKVGRVDTGWSKTGEPCWFAGQFYGDDGSSFYFYQAAVQVLGGTTTSGGAAGERYMGSAVSSGSRFRIVAVHPDDAYYSTRATVIGKHCTATDSMASQGSGWYSGNVTCSDASTYYFFKVGVVLE